MSSSLRRTSILLATSVSYVSRKDPCISASDGCLRCWVKGLRLHVDPIASRISFPRLKRVLNLTPIISRADVKLSSGSADELAAATRCCGFMTSHKPSISTGRIKKRCRNGTQKREGAAAAEMVNMVEPMWTDIATVSHVVYTHTREWHGCQFSSVHTIYVCLCTICNKGMQIFLARHN